MKQAGVSIIVPVYNVEKYLKRCVDSLLAQTCQELEIILVDDGSVDDSSRICDRYEMENQNITVIHKENGGLQSAWKAGLKAATAPLLCFVDSDDWIEPEMIAVMLQWVAGSGHEMICCNHVIDREKAAGIITSRQTQELPAGVYTREMLEKSVFPDLLGHENRPVSLSRCMKLISRALIEDNLHYCNKGIRMGEDVNIMLPAILDADRLVIMEEAYYYHYFFNADSMVHRYDAGLEENIDLLAEIIIRVLTDKNIKNAREQGKKEFLRLSMLVVKNEIRGNSRNSYRKIRNFCRGGLMKEAISQYPIKVSGKAEKLIYAVMKHPNRWMVLLLKMAIKLYDAKQRGKSEI